MAKEVLEAARSVQLSVGEGGGGLTDQEIKRLEMRKALAKRLKDDLVVG